MKVKNRKTGNEYILNKEDWDKLVSQNLSRLFTIIDESDDTKRIELPKSIIDYRIEYKPSEKTIPKKQNKK